MGRGEDKVRSRGRALGDGRPYLASRFIGVKPFTSLLEGASVEYLIFDDGSESALFQKRPDHFRPGDDAVRVGKCLQEGVEVYFAEYGIRITPSFRSHLVFLFDHHPTFEELLAAADDLEGLVEEGLAGVDPGDIVKMQ